MASRVVLHVGTMKSATTYLQGVFDANHEALSSNGIRWPGSALNFAGFADRLATDEHKRPEDGDWPTLRRIVAEEPDTVLLSNELLSLRRGAKLRPLLDETGWRPEVVITARDLGRVVPSQWVTGTLNRHPTPWTEFIDALVDEEHDHPAVAWFWTRQDVPRLVRTWSRLVGRSAVTLVTVPPAGAATTAIRDRFASVLGVDAGGYVEPVPEPAIGPATAEFIRRLGVAHPDLPRDQWRELVTAVVEPLVALPPEPKLRLAAGQLSWAQRRAEQLAASIDAAGVRVVGAIDDLIPAPDPGAPDHVAAPTEAELLAVAQRSRLPFSWNP